MRSWVVAELLFISVAVGQIPVQAQLGFWGSPTADAKAVHFTLQGESTLSFSRAFPRRCLRHLVATSTSITKFHVAI